MQFNKRSLFPLRKIGHTDFNFEREVEALSNAIIETTDVETDIGYIVGNMAEGEDHMLDWFIFIEGERIPFNELEDSGEYIDDGKEDGVIYVLDEYDLIAVLERYILHKNEMKSYQHIVKLFSIHRYVATATLYRIFHKYILIERIDNAKQIISTFFDGL